MTIQWEYPEPRKGFLGQWDKFIGPGATKAEVSIILITALSAGITMLFFAIFKLNWTVAKIIIGSLLALDISGGVVTNAMAPAKRWYHRQGRTIRHHLVFDVTHIYPFIVGLLYRSLDWVYSIVVYGVLVLSSIIILLLPLYLRRPVSFIVLGLTIIMNWYIFTPTKGLEWFIPILFLKIILGYIVKEEPYRP